MFFPLYGYQRIAKVPTVYTIENCIGSRGDGYFIKREDNIVPLVECVK